MSEFNITISANFWPRSKILPSVAEQYEDLWRFAKALQAIGVPLDEWYPPADTPANSMLNLAFGELGVTTAALAMANADKANKAADLRSLGAWNGLDEEGGMAFTTMLGVGPLPSHLDFSASNIEPLKHYGNVLRMVQAVLEIWDPVMILVGPYAYQERQVFKDRPPVSWMVYLPFKIETCNAPEASALIPVFDDHNAQKGTIVVSVAETFDPVNQEHVQRANELEIRLADQDLLPRFMDFMKFRPSSL